MTSVRCLRAGQAAGSMVVERENVVGEPALVEGGAEAKAGKDAEGHHACR